jgi:hypothetical protein
MPGRYSKRSPASPGLRICRTSPARHADRRLPPLHFPNARAETECCLIARKRVPYLRPGIDSASPRYRLCGRHSGRRGASATRVGCPANSRANREPSDSGHLRGIRLRPHSDPRRTNGRYTAHPGRCLSSASASASRRFRPFACRQSVGSNRPLAAVQITALHDANL